MKPKMILLSRAQKKDKKFDIDFRFEDKIIIDIQTELLLKFLDENAKDYVYYTNNKNEINRALLYD